MEPAIPEVNVPVAGGETLSVKAVYEPQQKIPLFEGESLTAQTVLRPLLFAPVEKGEVLGRVVLSCDGQKLSEITLTAAKSVPAREDDGNSLIGFFQRLIGF